MDTYYICGGYGKPTSHLIEHAHNDSMTHSQLFLCRFIWARQSLTVSDAGPTGVYCGLRLQLLPISCMIVFAGTEVMIKLLQCFWNKFKQQGQVNCLRELWREWKESKILANAPRNKQWFCTSKRRFAAIITPILLLLFLAKLNYVPILQQYKMALSCGLRWSWEPEAKSNVGLYSNIPVKSLI